jgi:glyoxylase-like metal-dependent hydrolase (beta-lactamase superfamily II)
VQRLAEDLWLLRGRPPYAINVYLAGEVLVDAGTRHAAGRILRELAGRTVRAHALTHAHPDHQGASHELCTRLDIPLWCGAGDAEAMETGEIELWQPDHWVNRLQQRYWTGPGHHVARRLREGDEVAGFRVLEVPGHSPGHVAYWREADRVLIAGDLLNHVALWRGRPGLREPLAVFTPDPARNRESIRRIAALEPALACFGHGPPLRGPDELAAFAAAFGGD